MTWSRSDFQTFVNTRSWRLAKTKPQMPHEYTLRSKIGPDPDFDRAVMFIRNYGYAERFRGRWYKYYDLGDLQYWTTGAPLAETSLINRAERR